MFSKRLFVGADPGDYVLELVEDIDLEGPCVGGESGLGVQRRLGSFLNLGLQLVFTSVFLEKLVISADLSDLVNLNLLAVLV